MSMEDLEQAGILLPREKWGKRPRKPTFSLWWFLPGGAVGIVSSILMFLGDGGLVTWVGVGMYLIGLLAFTLVTFLAIEKQN